MIFIENKNLLIFKIYGIINIESEGRMMDKRELKKSPEELQAYLMFKRRGSIVPAKKGRGSESKGSEPENRAPTRCGRKS